MPKNELFFRLWCAWLLMVSWRTYIQLVQQALVFGSNCKIVNRRSALHCRMILAISLFRQPAIRRMMSIQVAKYSTWQISGQAKLTRGKTIQKERETPGSTASVVYQIVCSRMFGMRLSFINTVWLLSYFVIIQHLKWHASVWSFQPRSWTLHILRLSDSHHVDFQSSKMSHRFDPGLSAQASSARAVSSQPNSTSLKLSTGQFANRRLMCVSLAKCESI